MKTTRYETLIQLTTYPLVFPVNCFLVEEDEGLTLVDAGVPASFRGIMDAVAALGKPITRIALTHAHGDHVGALDAVKAAFPDALVMISARDAKLMEGIRDTEPGEPNTPVKGSVPKNLQTRPDILLQEGDRVGSLTTLATPGHTPGSISFLDTRNQALIAGDAFQTRGGFAVSGQLRPLFPFPYMATWNGEVAMESAKKVLGASPVLLAIGHGPMLLDPVPHIKRAIAKAGRGN